MVTVAWQRDGRVRLVLEGECHPAVRALLLREGVTAKQAIQDVGAAMRADDPAAAVADILTPGWRDAPAEAGAEVATVEADPLAALAARVAALEDALAAARVAG